MVNDIYLIPDWSLDLFPLIPDIGDSCHEMSAMVHRDWTQQLQDLLTEVLQNRGGGRRQVEHLTT